MTTLYSEAIAATRLPRADILVAVRATGLSAHQLDQLTQEHVAAKSFAEFVGPEGGPTGYFPTIRTSRLLADAYDAARAAQGDPRRAYRGEAVNPTHNGGPPLDDRRSLAEAQADPSVHRRPSYLQRYAGTSSPMHKIVGIGKHGALGRWVLLACGHWKDLRDWDFLPLRGKKHPEKARCGCCREKIAPDADDVALAAKFETEGRQVGTR